MVESEPKIPQGLVADAGVLGVIDETPHREVGDDGAIDLGQGDAGPLRDDLAELAGSEPAAAEAAEEFIDGIEGAGVVLIPDVEIGVIAEMQVARGVPEGVAGDGVPGRVDAVGLGLRSVPAPGSMGTKSRSGPRRASQPGPEAMRKAPFASPSVARPSGSVCLLTPTKTAVLSGFRSLTMGRWRRTFWRARSAVPERRVWSCAPASPR